MHDNLPFQQCQGENWEIGMVQLASVAQLMNPIKQGLTPEKWPKAPEKLQLDTDISPVILTPFSTAN